MSYKQIQMQWTDLKTIEKIQINLILLILSTHKLWGNLPNFGSLRELI